MSEAHQDVRVSCRRKLHEAGLCLPFVLYQVCGLCSTPLQNSQADRASKWLDVKVITASSCTGLSKDCKLGLPDRQQKRVSSANHARSNGDIARLTSSSTLTVCEIEQKLRTRT